MKDSGKSASPYGDLDQLRTDNDPERRSVSRITIGVVAILALSLNQSGRLFGLNLSIADPLLLITFLVLAFDGRIRASLQAVGYFLVLSITTIITAVFITPVVFGTSAHATDIVLDFVKLLTSLLFFICGSEVSRRGMAWLAVRWFSIGATIVAAGGILLSAVGNHAFDSVLYYNFTRFRGLMVDPNYYAILAVAAIAYFVRDTRLPFVVRTGGIVILGYSIAMSGSKTGTVAVLVLVAIHLFDFSLSRKYAAAAVTALAVAASLVVVLWGQISATVYSFAQQYASVVPQLNRISELFNGSTDAAQAGGSGRVSVWSRGLDIIETSPIVGSGIGSYGAVAEARSGIGTLAHNTFIQIAAEWGLPLAAVFLVWIVVLLGRSTKNRSLLQSDSLMMRDIVTVFLIGSVSLSLNNARMFWFFLGALALLSIRRRDRGSQSRELAEGGTRW